MIWVSKTRLNTASVVCTSHFPNMDLDVLIKKTLTRRIQVAFAPNIINLLGIISMITTTLKKENFKLFFLGLTLRTQEVTEKASFMVLYCK